MAYQDVLLQRRLVKLFEEFVIPTNVLSVSELRTMLTKKERDRVQATYDVAGASAGARLLFDLLVEKPDWFDRLQIVLREKNVKLDHIAEIMKEERNMLIEQSARYRTSGSVSTAYSNLPTLSTLYIEYNKQLEDIIRPLFVSKIDDPVTAVNVLRQYSDKVLTQIDAGNVSAKVDYRGPHEGAILLFDRLVLYDSWLDVLKKVFNDPEIRLPDVAAVIEIHTNAITKNYEQKIQQLYQRTEYLHLADNRMDTDGPGSGTGARARPSSQDEFETDRAEMRPAAKKQARSYENKENTVSVCGSGDYQDVASKRGSSENREATIGKTELMSAAASGKLGSLLSLIDNGADLDESDSDGRTALMYAVNNGQFKCVQLLVSRGCDVNKRDTLGNTALMISARKDLSACMECLLDKQADVDNANDSGSTALMVASRKGFIDCIRLLIQKRCHVDKQHSDGRTALMYAAFHGHRECVNLLIHSKCDVNQSDKKGTTALMFAAENGQVECVRLLVNGHAKLNIVDEEGKTACMYAVLCNKVECLKVLVDNQANINIANQRGYTPLAVAIEKNHKRCMKVLRAAHGI